MLAVKPPWFSRRREPKWWLPWREPEGEETIELVRCRWRRCSVCKTDVPKASEGEMLVQPDTKRNLAAGYAFNNAPDRGQFGQFRYQSNEDWDQTININLKGGLPVWRHGIRRMIRQRGGGVYCKHGVDFRPHRCCWGSSV